MFLELIVLPEARTVLFYVIPFMIIFAVQCAGESCYQFRRKANVTIDTDQCLWQNYTEPKTKRFCVQSCINSATCTGVAMVEGKTARQCCFLVQTEILYRQPGDRILYHRKEATLKCNIDLGWTEKNCDSCAVNFGPPGQCDSCINGWAGDNCDYCEFFGFNTESNCTECIQNGYWKGQKRGKYVDVHLTFTGETCSELVPGTAMRYGTTDLTVASGYLDEANKRLRFDSENLNIFITTISDDKTLRHTNNNLLLTYMGMS